MVAIAALTHARVTILLTKDLKVPEQGLTHYKISRSVSI